MRPVWEFFQVDLSLLRARVDHPEASYVCILKLNLYSQFRGKGGQIPVLTVCPNCPMLILSRSRLKERNSYQTKPLPQGVPKNGFRIHWKSNLIVIIKTVRYRVKSTDQLFAGYQISGKERGHGWSDDFKR